MWELWKNINLCALTEPVFILHFGLELGLVFSLTFLPSSTLALLLQVVVHILTLNLALASPRRFLDVPVQSIPAPSTATAPPQAAEPSATVLSQHLVPSARGTAGLDSILWKMMCKDLTLVFVWIKPGAAAGPTCLRSLLPATADSGCTALVSSNEVMLSPQSPE